MTGAMNAAQLDLALASMEAVQRDYESPIELIFGMAAALTVAGLGMRLVPQYRLDRFRYDFAVTSLSGGFVFALVECDGKEFHSSPDQRANDQCKDAAAKAAGIIIVRFSGAAIHNETRRCATDLAGHIRLAWRLP
jgi:very-short-patch-repair endonuclease